MLDERRGAVLSSNYEYPGRYSRWDIAFVDPPVALTARGRSMTIEALNARAHSPPAFDAAVRAGDDLVSVETTDRAIALTVKAPAGRFAEEERSRQPSVFSVIRRIVAHFATDETATSASGARSATISPSSSSRCASAWNGRRASATSCSTSPTRC